MRTTQRNFVVEYKTRRPTKARSPSIWGNLDLRAVSLQIEADGVLPDADRADVQSIADPDVTDLAISPSNEPHVQTETVLAGEDDLSLQSPPDELPAIETSLPHDNLPIARKSDSSSKPGNRVSIQGRAAEDFLKVSTCCNGEDDLDALEQENRRLKSFMIIKLRQENAELRSMLKRFEVL